MENQNDNFDKILTTNEKASNTIDQIIEAMQEPNVDYTKIINRLMGIAEDLINNNIELVSTMATLTKKSKEMLEDKHRTELRSYYNQTNAKETENIEMKIRQNKETEQLYQDYGKFSMNENYKDTLIDSYNKELAFKKDKHNQMYSQLITPESNISEENINAENSLPGNILT